MNATTRPLESKDDHVAPPHLSWLSFGICLGILLAIFAFLNPIWEAEEMSAWNENIWWSYIPIPLLVLVFLKFEGKLALSSLVLDTMKLTFVKFVITITVANALWEFWGTPGTDILAEHAVPTETDLPDFEAGEVPSPTPLDPAQLGALQLQLRGPGDAPLVNAWVWIGSGLEQVVFPVPQESLELVNDGSRYSPDFSLIQLGQTLELSATDGEVHTIAIDDLNGERYVCLPLLREKSSHLVKRQRSSLRIHCSVHEGPEDAATLIYTNNPFHARTDDQGRVNFEGVPAGELEVNCRLADGTTSARPVVVEAGRARSLDLIMD